MGQRCRQATERGQALGALRRTAELGELGQILKEEQLASDLAHAVHELGLREADRKGRAVRTARNPFATRRSDHERRLFEEKRGDRLAEQYLAFGAKDL